MRNRALALLLILCFAFPALAQEALEFSILPSPLRPGKAERIAFIVQAPGKATVTLTKMDGTLVFTLRNEMSVLAGVNNLVWDGCDASDAPIAAGEYLLAVAMDGATATSPITVGEPGPRVSLVSADDNSVMLRSSCAGTLLVRYQAGDETPVVASISAEKGEQTVPLSALPDGKHTLYALLTDETGFESNVLQFSATVAGGKAKESAAPLATEQEMAKQHISVPSRTLTAQDGGSYWTLPIGVMDEAAIWKVMMQPITVIDGDDQRNTYKLRATRDSSTKSANILGEITFLSQGVNVLESYEDGWSLVEAFNSSYGPDCESRPGYGNSDEIITGYVRTDLLKTITPVDSYGLLLDKLSQTMYVFKDGKIFSELMVSTGLPTNAQPWNETPSGEYLMVSRTGDFPAGNLTCAMGMRINGGCMIHEVPYIYNEKYDVKDYSSSEPQLGAKASHGCVRVQRAKNAEGLNMRWLWNNIKINTKVLIWDDSGRFIAYPPDTLPLFYNPDGGKYYHADQNCASIKSRWLPLKGQFTYAELDDSKHQKFVPCTSCNPPQRKADIDAVNAANGF